MKEEMLKKILITLAANKNIVAASSIALAGIIFVILGDPWDADNPWL